MSFDKTVRENLDGEYLIIHANEFKEGVEYAAQIKIGQIQLRGMLGHENPDATVDFKGLEKLAGHLRIISFVSTIENVVNFESIYSLRNLEKIYINEKQKFQIDISKFPSLQHLGSEYWKGLLNFHKTYTLTSLVIIKLPDINLRRLAELKNLKILHVYSSKIQTLEGVEKLSIEEVFLARNNS